MAYLHVLLFFFICRVRTFNRTIPVLPFQRLCYCKPFHFYAINPQCVSTIFDFASQLSLGLLNYGNVYMEQTSEHLNQGPQASTNPLPAFLNKVLFEHSCAHSCTVQWRLCTTTAELTLVTKPRGLESIQYLLSSFLQKVADPWSQGTLCHVILYVLTHSESPVQQRTISSSQADSLPYPTKGKIIGKNTNTILT